MLHVTIRHNLFFVMYLMMFLYILGYYLFLDRSSQVEKYEVPDDLNKIDDSSAYLQTDDALFTMDESKILPGNNNEGVIKMGDGRELQDLWPYGNDAL